VVRSVSLAGIVENNLSRMTRLLRGWELDAGVTLAERLAAAVADLVDQGELRAGFRLPSERRLAEALAVSRGTVTAAYGRLKADGRLESRPGSGARVLSVNGRRPADGNQIDGRLATVHQRGGRRLDLSSGALPGLSLTAEVALAALRDRLPALVASDGYEPQGLLELREEVARYYDQLGAPTTPDQITITAGSQQALQILSDAFVSPGDTVVVEDPTYRGALDVLRNHGAKLVPVQVAVDGPDTAALERLVQRLRPRIVYLLPTAHNPTGYVVSSAKARAIATILETSDTLFIEDGSPADLVLDRPRPPTPVGVGLDAERWVAIGSVSKLFWGGLRLGWIRASNAVTQRIARIKTVADLGTSQVSQAIAIECLKEAERARAERQQHLLERLDAASSVLDELAPEWSWRRPQGGSAL
jgi:DNA-binding transcriptional MocR family regulator